MVRQQREHEVHQWNAEHGEEETYFAYWRIRDDLAFGVHSVDEQHRREEKADQEIGDGQVCDEKVEGLVNWFVRDIRVDHHSITERAQDDSEKIQRANERCGGSILLVVLHVSWLIVKTKLISGQRPDREQKEFCEVIFAACKSVNEKQWMWFMAQFRRREAMRNGIKLRFINRFFFVVIEVPATQVCCM